MTAMWEGGALRPPTVSWPYVGEVLRSLAGVLLAVLAAWHWAPIGVAGMAVATVGSASVAGAIALHDSPHARVPLVLGVSMGIGMTVLAGSLVSSHTAPFLVLVTSSCFAAGMCWAISRNAGLVASAACVVLVVCPPAPDVVTALRAAAVATAGGLLQVLLVAAWPRQRWKDQRRALRDAYGWVAAGARRLAEEPGAELDATPLLDLRAAYVLTESQARRRPPAHRGLHALPERIAMTLNVLRAENPSAPLREALLAGADALDALDRSDRAGADAALRRLDESVAAVQEPAATAARRFGGQVGEACALHFAGVPGLRGAQRAGWAAITGQLSGNSPILRHALRLTVATGVAVALARGIGLGHGEWIALTVLLALRPETAHTYTRCISRVVGVLAGVLVATVLAILLHPAGALVAVPVVVALGLSYALAGFGAVPMTGALAAGIAFLLDIEGTADSADLSQRLMAVVLGGGLAVASHVLLPDRSLVRLRQRAGELLKAEIDYAATVIRGFVHPLPHAGTTLNAAWQRAVRARSAFEAASGSVRAEAPEVRRWLTSYRAALNAVTGACVTLEEHVAAARPESLDPRFVVAVDDYVDALRGEPPSAGQPWTVDARHLAETDAQLRDAAGLLDRQNTAQRVLLAETETITRHLLGVEVIRR